MASNPTGTRAADLGFRVFTRAVHPDWFATKAHRRIARGPWIADIRIIDGGHAVHWRSDDARLTEVLAGPDADLPDSGLAFASKLGRERSTSLQPGDRLEYQTSFEIERCDREVFAHLTDEATLDASRHALFASTASRDRLAPPAVCLIRYEPTVKGLAIHTFRSFPAERAIVRTHSLIESRLALPAR